MTSARILKEELHYHTPYPAIALVGFGMAVIAAVAAALSGVGSRLGWWYFGTGFTILVASAGLGLVGALADAVSAVIVRGPAAKHIFTVALLGVVIGLAATGIPAYWIRTAYRMPAIHDITTDMNDPPAFVAIMPLRQGAANPASYGGPEVAAEQKAAYPEVRPLILPVSPQTAFQQALQKARKMGWTIVAADPAQGRIEAMATTFWFGFKDDIVVRVRPDDFGSRVDVRSVSRVGLGDLGTNARRVMKYLYALGRES
jgi:uncharacterized protein (DUF1499 family)